MSSLVDQSASKTKIVAKDFGAKFQDKREVYHFLTYDCGAYLPPYDNVTIFHMRDLAAGTKTIIKGKDILHISIPQFEGLSIESFLEFSKGYTKVRDALPEVQKELVKMPRQYIANIIHTIVG